MVLDIFNAVPKIHLPWQVEVQKAAVKGRKIREI